MPSLWGPAFSLPAASCQAADMPPERWHAEDTLSSSCSGRQTAMMGVTVEPRPLGWLGPLAAFEQESNTDSHSVRKRAQAAQRPAAEPGEQAPQSQEQSTVNDSVMEALSMAVSWEPVILCPGGVSVSRARRLVPCHGCLAGIAEVQGRLRWVALPWSKQR